MSTVLIILAFLCLAIGIAGAVIPGLPGPPVSWVGLLLAALTPKRLGGSKYGIWGCNIGLVISFIGLPFGPHGLLGVIFWPFAGALIGEYINQHEWQPALRAAWGAFLGFLSGTLLKLVYCIALLVVVIAKLL